MNTRLHLALFAALSLGISGCVTTEHAPEVPEAGTRGGGPVNEWVDDALTPYLKSELVNNPKFDNASVLLVKLDGEQVAADIDTLSEEIRNNLFDSLLADNQINLARRNGADPSQQHPRTLANVNCGQTQLPTHFVGFELRESPAGGHRVSARALDIRDNQWVSGFGQSWAGELSEDELSASGNKLPDSFLRGLRPLPFDAEMADLTTSYLANNLSCLIRDAAGQRLTMYVRPPAQWAPNFFHTVSKLLERYMNTFQEVEIVASAAAADAVVDSEMVQINDDLWQVWAGVELKKDGRRLSGADTPAYVQLDPVSAALVRGTQTIGSGTSVQSSRNANAPVTRNVAITSLRALVPNDYGYCDESNPWETGIRWVGDEVLPAKGCFAIEAKATGYAHYLIAENSEGEWFRLLDSECQLPTFKDPAGLARTGQWRFPDRSVMKFVGGGYVESFFLIVAGDKGTANAVKEVIEVLPDRCRATRGTPESPLDNLTVVARQYPGKLLWRKLEIRHFPDT